MSAFCNVDIPGTLDRGERVCCAHLCLCLSVLMEEFVELDGVGCA
jgi:hypothetical protein